MNVNTFKRKEEGTTDFKSQVPKGLSFIVNDTPGVGSYETNTGIVPKKSTIQQFDETDPYIN